MVRHVRRLTGVAKVGHAGTLDPFASGVLLLGIGREYTKQLGTFLDTKKTYEVAMVFGMATHTYDAYGKVTACQPPTPMSVETVTPYVNQFLGTTWQRPPMFSAKKIGGIPAYRLARQRAHVDLPLQKITLFDQHIIAWIDHTYPILKWRVTCSKGTYIRTLVHDIGQKMGIPAYTKALCRTTIGPYHIDQSVNGNDMHQDAIINHIFVP